VRAVEPWLQAIWSTEDAPLGLAGGARAPTAGGDLDSLDDSRAFPIRASSRPQFSTSKLVQCLFAHRSFAPHDPPSPQESPAGDRVNRPHPRIDFRQAIDSGPDSTVPFFSRAAATRVGRWCRTARGGAVWGEKAGPARVAIQPRKTSAGCCQKTSSPPPADSYTMVSSPEANLRPFGASMNVTRNHQITVSNPLCCWA